MAYASISEDLTENLLPGASFQVLPHNFSTEEWHKSHADIASHMVRSYDVQRYSDVNSFSVRFGLRPLPDKVNHEHLLKLCFVFSVLFDEQFRTNFDKYKKLLEPEHEAVLKAMRANQSNEFNLLAGLAASTVGAHLKGRYQLRNLNYGPEFHNNGIHGRGCSENQRATYFQKFKAAGAGLLVGGATYGILGSLAALALCVSVASIVAVPVGIAVLGVISLIVACKLYKSKVSNYRFENEKANIAKPAERGLPKNAAVFNEYNQRLALLMGDPAQAHQAAEG